MVVFTKCGPDLKEHIYDVPVGVTPDHVAKDNGLVIYECADSEGEARRKLATDPNGRLESF